jgi:hypothetical protein
MVLKCTPQTRSAGESGLIRARILERKGLETASWMGQKCHTWRMSSDPSNGGSHGPRRDVCKESEAS